MIASHLSSARTFLVRRISLAACSSPPTNNSIETRLSEATTQFGLNFLNNLPEDTRKNVIFSPISLQILMNMLLFGSTDNSNTQRELSRVLGYEATGLMSATNPSADRLRPHEAMRNVHHNILAAIESSRISKGAYNERTASRPNHPLETQKLTPKSSTDENSFNLANLVLTEADELNLKQDYVRDLKTYYDAGFEQFSTCSNPKSRKGLELLCKRINNYVANNTQNQIENLVDEVILKGAIMVLINAVYFKGRWLNIFESQSSKNRLFHNHGSVLSKSLVKFMQQENFFGYANISSKNFVSDLHCTALSMPYSVNQGGELDMVILLPAKVSGIDKLQKALDAQTLNEIYRSLEKRKVAVKIPEFSFEQSIDARLVFERMGLRGILARPALDGMLTSRGIPEVSKIMHKARVSIDETGTLAAAVSMLVLVGSSRLSRPTPEFKADHPFLFIIRHSRSNMPLFIGRINRL